MFMNVTYYNFLSFRMKSKATCFLWILISLEMLSSSVSAVRGWRWTSEPSELMKSWWPCVAESGRTRRRLLRNEFKLNRI